MALRIFTDDIQWIIFKYISSDCSNLIKDAIKTDKFKLKYVRRFILDENGYFNIWEELKPSTIGKIYYGDENKLRRTKLSKGEQIRLKTLNISF